MELETRSKKKVEDYLLFFVFFGRFVVLSPVHDQSETAARLPRCRMLLAAALCWLESNLRKKNKSPTHVHFITDAWPGGRSKSKPATLLMYEPGTEHVAPLLPGAMVKLLTGAVRIVEMLDFVGSAAADWFLLSLVVAA